MPGAEEQGLRELARLYGIQRSYRDTSGRRQRAGVRSVLAVLQALGAPVRGPQDVASALRQRRQERWQQAVDPVAVAWDGACAVDLRLPAEASGLLRATLAIDESGQTELSWTISLGDLVVVDRSEVEGVRFQVRRLAVPGPLPPGYHTLTIQLSGRRHECTIISAPTRPGLHWQDPTGRKRWGVFLPLYALRTGRDWGAGDFTDLDALMEWAADLGAEAVATLPFLASFLDEPLVPSPYMPASRLFWNELYVDVERAPEFSQCREAQQLLASGEFRREIARLRSSTTVDYRALMTLKRRLLALLAGTFFATRSPRSEALGRFLRDKPNAEDYAQFRAVAERRRRPWPEWPARLRDGRLRPGDYEQEAVQYHLYAQWTAEEQLAGLAARAGKRGQGLYLDLPLGAHGHGYDVWRERTAFATTASAGAPPDAFFSEGQMWAMPPLIPDRLRDQRYTYVRACLQHHLRHAKILRIDHIMGLHRLYWIPEGADARHGVYVRYPADELYAIACLEAFRHGAQLVGENLGTVPSYVNAALRRHDINEMYVAQFALHRGRRPFGTLPEHSMASLNTHDMPPFASYWEGRDIERRRKLGYLSAPAAGRERRGLNATRRSVIDYLQRRGRLGRSETSTGAVMRASLSELAAAPPVTVLINLEDLWLEPRPQNVPGTTDEHPNWRRKARYPLERLSTHRNVLGALSEVDRLRRHTPAQ